MYHKRLIYLLLLSSLSVNAMHDHKNAKEITIHEAVYRGDVKKVKELLGSGINVNERAKEAQYDTYSLKNESPLYIATVLRKKNIVQFLLEHNASVNVKNRSGSTPFLYALYEGKVDYIKVFLACGADNNLKYMGDTPLHIAAHEAFSFPPSYSSSDYLSIVKTLLKYNAQVNIENDKRKTPLDILLKIKGIKEFYLDNERSQKTAKKIKKVRRIRKRCKRKIVVNKNKY